MSFSGFVHNELRFLNGLWLFRSQSIGLVAYDEDFDGAGCSTEK